MITSMEFEIYLGTAIVIILLIMFINQMRFVRYNKRKLEQDEYMVVIKTIELTLSWYKSSILNPRLSAMSTTYDLDPSSQSNAIKKYNTDVDQLLRKSAKMIIDTYLSSDIRIVAFKYFSLDSLILFIITTLKMD